MRSNNFTLLLKSVENHTQRTNSLPHVYNLEVAPTAFPYSKDRANMSKRISDNIRKTNAALSTKVLRRIDLTQKSVDIITKE